MIIQTHFKLQKKRPRGFTLIELIVVMGLMVAMISLVGPAMTSLKRGADVSQAVYEVKGILDQSRAYAMGNNTFVYVGFAEVDASLPAGSNQTGTAGGGRLVIAAVASKDGTPTLDVTGSNAVAIRKLQRFENLHLADFSESKVNAATTGPMKARAEIDGINSLSIGQPIGSATPVFTWPLGSASSNAQYLFSQVVRYSPEGVATFQTAASNTLGRYLEVALQQSRGATLPDLPTNLAVGNQAVVQINGITGSTRIFRP
jgi:prepilin-type N-terminal cleavage/methylation domain-containing protein